MRGKPTIAVLGTGTIGFPVARNLARAGYDIHAWNRTREKAEPLANDGVTVAGSATEAAAAADVVITLLADGSAVEEVMDEVAPAAKAGTTWIQSSTVGVPATERLTDFASEHELVLVDAPVLGTKEPAEKVDSSSSRPVRSRPGKPASRSSAPSGR